MNRLTVTVVISILLLAPAAYAQCGSVLQDVLAIGREYNVELKLSIEEAKWNEDASSMYINHCIDIQAVSRRYLRAILKAETQCEEETGEESLALFRKLRDEAILPTLKSCQNLGRAAGLVQ